MLRVVKNPMPYALGLAWLGQWIHDIHFLPATLGFGAAAIPWLLLTVALYTYWRVSSGSAVSLVAILIYAGIALTGAIVTILPLSILPFAPEQTLGHYLAHIVFALCQVPVIVVTFRQFARARVDSATQS